VRGWCVAVALGLFMGMMVPVPVEADNPTKLYGYVLDIDTQQAIPNVEIEFYDVDTSEYAYEITDGNGYYELAFDDFNEWNYGDWIKTEIEHASYHTYIAYTTLSSSWPDEGINHDYLLKSLPEPGPNERYFHDTIGTMTLENRESKFWWMHNNGVTIPVKATDGYTHIVWSDTYSESDDGSGLISGREYLVKVRFYLKLEKSYNNVLNETEPEYWYTVSADSPNSMDPTIEFKQPVSAVMAQWLYFTQRIGTYLYCNTTQQLEHDWQYDSAQHYWEYEYEGQQ